MPPSTQKALLLDAKFGKFVVDTIPVPKPGPGEVLVKIQAAALNPVDWKVQKYGIFADKFPAVLGMDIAGDVEELGEGVTDSSVGDLHYHQDLLITHHLSLKRVVQGDIKNEYAGFQQYALGIAASVAKVDHVFSLFE